MDELEKILGIIGKHGWQPILSAGVLLLLLRFGKPEIVAPAVRTIYADIGHAIGTWWESHRELVEAQRDRAQAQAARDRALEVAWSSDQAGANPLNRRVPGPAPERCHSCATGERRHLGASQSPLAAGDPVGAGDPVDPVDDPADDVAPVAGGVEG